MCIAPWIFVSALSGQDINYKLCLFLLGLAGVSTAVIFISYLYMIGSVSDDIYVYRAGLYNFIREPRSEVINLGSCKY